MRIAICDGERETTIYLKEWIEAQKTEDEVTTFFLAEDLLRSNQTFDLVFLDIQMPGIDGIQAAKKLREEKIQSLIVFVTGEKEYVFDAFDVNAFHYLLKPIDEKKLGGVLNKARKYIRDRSLDNDSVIIKTRRNHFNIKKSEILYVESQRKKCEIYTMNRCVECYGTMKEFEELLGSSFYRCHRGYLVNMDKITGYTADTIQLEKDQWIYLSKNRYADFVRTYMKYIKSRR